MDWKWKDLALEEMTMWAKLKNIFRSTLGLLFGFGKYDYGAGVEVLLSADFPELLKDMEMKLADASDSWFNDEAEVACSTCGSFCLASIENLCGTALENVEKLRAYLSSEESLAGSGFYDAKKEKPRTGVDIRHIKGVDGFWRRTIDGRYDPIPPRFYGPGFRKYCGKANNGKLCELPDNHNCNGCSLTVSPYEEELEIYEKISVPSSGKQSDHLPSGDIPVGSEDISGRSGLVDKLGECC